MQTDKLSPFRSVPDLVVSTEDGERTDFAGISARVFGRVASAIDITSDRQIFQDVGKTVLVSFMLDTLVNGPNPDDIDSEIETFAPSVVVYDNKGPVLLNPEFCRALGSNPAEIRKRIEEGTYVDWAYDEANAARAKTLVDRLKLGLEYRNESLDYRNGIMNRWTSFGFPGNGGSIRFAESGRHGFLTTLDLGKGDDLDAKTFVSRIRSIVLEIIPESDEELRRQADALITLLETFDRAWNETPFAMNVWLPNAKNVKSLNNPAYVAVTGYPYEVVRRLADEGKLVSKLYLGTDRFEVEDAVRALNEGEVDSYFQTFNARRADGTSVSLGWIRRRYGNTLASERVRELSDGRLEPVSRAIGNASFGVATAAKTGEQQVLEDLVKDFKMEDYSGIRFE